MSALAFRSVTPAAFDWRAILDEIGPQIAEEGRRCDENNQFAAANFELLRAREFLALAVPAELGGLGLSRTETAQALRALAHYCPSTALALAMHTHVTAAAAWRWQHQKAPTDGLLKRIATERIQLLSSGGSDWLPGSGTAEKVEGGYRVSGRKTFASGAPAAQLFMTGAIEDDPREGPTVLQFGVPMNAKGVSIDETWDTLGMRGTGSHDVVFDGVFVPDAAIARAPQARRLASAAASGVDDRVSDGLFGLHRHRREGARHRGRPSGEAARSSVELIGELETELASVRMACDAWSRSARPRRPVRRPPTRSSSTARWSRAARLRTADLAMDVTGGAAYFRRVGLERLFRDIQGARFHPLPTHMQRRLAGRTALGLPIDG